MSAKAIWRSFSSISSGTAKTCSASTTHMMLSNRMRSRRLSPMNVRAMPDGSATPLASRRMYSGCSGRVIDLRHRSDQIVADVAADTAVGEADDVAIALDADNEVGVDVDRAEVVDQDSDAKTVIAGEDAVQQRRLAGAEESRQHGEWDGFGAGSDGRNLQAVILRTGKYECGIVSH